MIKKNGFTLIELLAVIVILAVIALIATPLIMNTINDARDSAMQRSIQNIQHSAEQHLMSKKVLNSDYAFSMSDFDYKGEKYDKMKISFNDKDESNVAVYKGKCFYILAGSNDVVIDDTLDEAGCLAKAKTTGLNEYGFYFDRKYINKNTGGESGMILTENEILMSIIASSISTGYRFDTKAFYHVDKKEYEFSDDGLTVTRLTDGKQWTLENYQNYEMNEYGFYQDVWYESERHSIKFYYNEEDGYAYDHKLLEVFADDFILEKNKIILDEEADVYLQFSDNGKKVEFINIPMFAGIVLELAD